jgi:SAM-dependent methyltransferase
MIANSPASPYALGSTDSEHERLIRQAARLAPCTERFFRDAGIGTGQRVLDLGSGVGDVAMLVARLVGHSGDVVGIERDTRSNRPGQGSRRESRSAQCKLHPNRCEPNPEQQAFRCCCRPFHSDVCPQSPYDCVLSCSVGSTWWSLSLPRALLGDYLCDYDALAPLVDSRLSDVRNVPALRGKSRDGIRSLSDVSGGGTARASHADGGTAWR